MVDDNKSKLFTNFKVDYADRLLFTKSLPCGTNVAVVELMYHVALYVNPEVIGTDFTHDGRFCYYDLDTAKKGIDEFENSSRWRFYKKDHDNNLAVSGKHIYRSGDLALPEYAQGEVDWFIDQKGRLIE